MKRADILRLLAKAGCEFREGGRHTLVYRDGVLVTEVPRHKEVNEILSKKIPRDGGVKK